MTVASAIRLDNHEVVMLDIENSPAGGGTNYKGLWNASTNTPFLSNGVGTEGDYYEVSVGGTVDFGQGDILFIVGDTVVYQNGIWGKGKESVINDDEISATTTWSSTKILQVIETSSTADVFTYKGETNELPDGTGETPNNKGDVWLLTTDGLPYWWDGDVWRRFGVDAYTKAETDILLAGKVDEEAGKGLSTEDFTTAEKTKLAGIENGAEVNTIESVSVNNVALTPDANKNVNVTVPTKTSDLTNDSNFVTTSDLATVAETGSYDDLTDKPTLGTASEKDSTTYVNPGNNNIPTSNAVYQAMTSMLEGAFHPAGNKTCAELTSDLLVQANVGHIYKITDNGVTDANWIGGAGQTITANQLAVVVYGNTAGTFLFNLENGINVDMSTYQTKAITPITVDGNVKSNVEDALDAINTLAGSNKTGLGNKADKVSGATNGDFAGLDANGNLTDSGINADSLNDLQLTYNGSTYSTTSALITKLTSDIVARKHSSGTVGGNISITWTGKSCVTGSYSIHDSGAGFVVLDFENDQDGNNHCTYSISSGSAVYINWSKFATKSNFYNLSSYGGYATGTKIWWKIPNLFVVGSDFTYRTNVFLLSARDSGFSALLTIGDNGSNTRTARITMLNGTLDGVSDFYFDSSTCSLYYAIQWSRLQIVQLSGQKIDIAEAIQTSSSEATQYIAITPTITADRNYVETKIQPLKQSYILEHGVYSPIEIGANNYSYTTIQLAHTYSFNQIMFMLTPVSYVNTAYITVSGHWGGNGESSEGWTQSDKITVFITNTYSASQSAGFYWAIYGTDDSIIN